MLSPDLSVQFSSKEHKKRHSNTSILFISCISKRKRVDISALYFFYDCIIISNMIKIRFLPESDKVMYTIREEYISLLSEK